MYFLVVYSMIKHLGSIVHRKLFNQNIFAMISGETCHILYFLIAVHNDVCTIIMMFTWSPCCTYDFIRDFLEVNHAWLDTSKPAFQCLQCFPDMVVIWIEFISSWSIKLIKIKGNYKYNDRSDQGYLNHYHNIRVLYHIDCNHYCNVSDCHDAMTVNGDYFALWIRWGGVIQWKAKKIKWFPELFVSSSFLCNKLLHASWTWISCFGKMSNPASFCALKLTTLRTQADVAANFYSATDT